jgi:hypothetical protein
LVTVPAVPAQSAKVSAPVVQTPSAISLALVDQNAAVANSSDDCKSRECLIGMIQKYALKYGVDPKLAVDIAICESQLRVDVYGDNGLAHGVFQFHEATFNLFAKQYGLTNASYWDTSDNVQLAMIAIGRGRGSHWTCYAKVKNA